MPPEQALSPEYHSRFYQSKRWPSRITAAGRPNYLDGPESIQLDDDISEVRALLDEKSELHIPTDLRDNISLAISQVSPTTPSSATTPEVVAPAVGQSGLCSRSLECPHSKVRHSHRHTHIHYRSPDAHDMGTLGSPVVTRKELARSKTCSPAPQTTFATRTARRAYVRRRAASAGISAFHTNRAAQVTCPAALPFCLCLQVCEYHILGNQVCISAQQGCPVVRYGCC
jgi:hypothetical protein